MSEEMKSPQLRFPGFSGEWEEKRYGDIYSFYTSNSLSRDNLNYEKGEVKNIHYGDIHTKFPIMFKSENEELPFINSDIDLSKIKDENYCKVGDLVVADASEDYNDIGKTIEILSLDDKKTLAGLHTFLARQKNNEIAIGYVGYLLNSWNVRKQVMTIAQGTKVLGLSTGRLSKVKLNLPATKLEQEKIASFLSLIDIKIEQHTSRKALLEQYKKGVMQKIFNKEIRFKADDRSEFPEWEEKKLGDVANRSTVKNRDNTVSFVLTNSATKGILSQQDYFYKDIANQGNLEGYYVVELNDFIYNPRISVHAPVGPIKRNKLRQGVMSPLYTVFRFDDSFDFYEHYFETSEWHKYMKSVANYGARHDRMAISNSDFLNMPIPLPCSDERSKITDFISSLRKKVELSGKELSLVKEFKKALLQQMFI